jgi:hypothetical protein
MNVRLLAVFFISLLLTQNIEYVLPEPWTSAIFHVLGQVFFHIFILILLIVLFWVFLPGWPLSKGVTWREHLSSMYLGLSASFLILHDKEWNKGVEHDFLHYRFLLDSLARASGKHDWMELPDFYSVEFHEQIVKGQNEAIPNIKDENEFKTIKSERELGQELGKINDELVKIALSSYFYEQCKLGDESLLAEIHTLLEKANSLLPSSLMEITVLLSASNPEGGEYVH